MKRTAVFLLLLFLAGLACYTTASAAPLFPDVPESHWARDAVADLAAKGILEGYPDGTFKGDRGTTRWEMALMLQRALAKTENELLKKATKADLEALRALVVQLKDELSALGVRVRNLEDKTDALDKRTTELERITFYGYARGIYAFNDVFGTLPNAGTRLAPVTDWTNGRLLVTGHGWTNMVKLGTLVRATKESHFGVEFSGYYSGGDTIVGSYWGVTAPYLSNPYTTQGTATPGLQGKNNIPWNKVSLDRFWYNHKPTETVLSVGVFHPQEMEGMLLKGQRNPNINEPEILPFYGVNVHGKFSRKKDCNWSYEASYSKLPQASFMMTHMAAASIIWRNKKTRVRIHGTNANNRMHQDGQKIAAGNINAPTLPSYPVAPGNTAVYWRNLNGSIINSKIGPQRMSILGLDLNHKFSKYWNVYAKGAFSKYDPDTSKVLFNSSVSGSAFDVGLKYKSDKLDGKLNYQYASSDYDPFVLQYPGAGSGIPVFLPYSTYYFNYYQLHDYINYPSNRQGFKLNLGYNFTKKTRLYVKFGQLNQVTSSTLTNMTTPGHVEPLFPVIQTAGSNVKGSVQDWGAHVRHKFSDRFTGRAGYYWYRQNRNTFAVDDIDLREDLVFANLRYKLSPTSSLFGNYYYVNYRGHMGLANQSFRQHVPSISYTTKVNKNIDAGLTYRRYYFKNRLQNNADWNANQFIFDWKYKF